MNRIIYILLFCFCQHGCCISLPSVPVDEKIASFFGTGSDSAPTPEPVRLRIPDYDRVKRDTNGGLWSFSIPFSDKTTKQLNLKRIEGYLIDSNLPAWEARGGNNMGPIIYSKISLAKELGRMDFYHDYEQKAAVVVYHDAQIIEGFVGYYRFQLETDDITNDDGQGKTYSLVPQPQFFGPRSSGVPTRAPGDPLLAKRLKPQPDTIYAQLLIQLARADVRDKGLAQSLREMIMYWNAVNMVYSQLEYPHIQFNMAGLIIPMDEYTAPWLKLNKYDGYSGMFVSAVTALNAVGDHFYNHRHIFPEKDFHFMISFTEYAMDKGGITSGIAFKVTNCNSGRRNQRAALISNHMGQYLNAAHEAGHLFSADHDEKYKLCENFGHGLMSQFAFEHGSTKSFEWSECAKRTFQMYFRFENTYCMENCPRTKPDCHNAPVDIPVKVPEHIDEPFKPHCFKRLIFPEQMCPSSFPEVTDISCSGNIVCITKGEYRREFTIIPLNGTACEYDGEKIYSVCYLGECKPIDEDSPKCVLLEENQ